MTIHAYVWKLLYMILRLYWNINKIVNDQNIAIVHPETYKYMCMFKNC